MQRNILMLAVTAVIAIGSASGPGPASADTTPGTYTDPAGDSATAPDLTKVTFTVGTGTITVDITYTGALGSDGSLLLLLDADRNAQTGSDGIDYLILGNGTRLAFLKWDGTQWVDFTHQPMSPTLNSTDMTFVLTLADIGGVQTFDFAAGAVRANDIDTAPDSGMATYAVPVAAPPVTTPPAATPATLKAVLAPSGGFAAKAGKVLRVPSLQVRLTDGTTADADRQTCSLVYQGKKLAPLAGGCAWKIPKAYKRARLTLTVTVSYGGKTVSKSWNVSPR